MFYFSQVGQTLLFRKLFKFSYITASKKSALVEFHQFQRPTWTGFREGTQGTRRCQCCLPLCSLSLTLAIFIGKVFSIADPLTICIALPKEGNETGYG